jgi:hypothetical protein
VKKVERHAERVNDPEPGIGLVWAHYFGFPYRRVDPDCGWLCRWGRLLVDEELWMVVERFVSSSLARRGAPRRWAIGYLGAL